MQALDSVFFQTLKSTMESIVKDKGSCTREILRQKLSLPNHYDNIITFCFDMNMFPDYEMKRRVGIRLKSNAPVKEVKKRIPKNKSLAKDLEDSISSDESLQEAI